MAWKRETSELVRFHDFVRRRAQSRLPLLFLLVSPKRLVARSFLTRACAIRWIEIQSLNPPMQSFMQHTLCEQYSIAFNEVYCNGLPWQCEQYEPNFLWVCLSGNVFAHMLSHPIENFKQYPHCRNYGVDSPQTTIAHIRDERHIFRLDAQCQPHETITHHSLTHLIKPSVPFARTPPDKEVLYHTVEFTLPLDIVFASHVLRERAAGISCREFSRGV